LTPSRITPNPASIRFHDSAASALLDLARGIAAVLVLLSHWKLAFFLDFHLLRSHQRWFEIPYILTTAGHQAVLIFFVLSGYLISSSVFRSFDLGRWSWRTYLLNRFVRLWIVLLPGLLLGFLCDWIGIHFTHAAALYDGSSYRNHFINVGSTLTPGVFLGNAAFLQTLIVPPLGSNGPLWSLANEFWYYILFPLGLLSLRRTTPLGQRLLYILLFAAVAWFTRAAILPLFPVWLAGTALALLPNLHLRNATRWSFAIVYIGLLFGWPRFAAVTGYLADLIFGAITFFFFWTLLSARHAARGIWAPFSRKLARFSYTLYIVHSPMVILLVALLSGETPWSPAKPSQGLLGLAVLFAVIAYAWIVAFFTEFRTGSVRSFLERHLVANHRAPAASRLFST
jgi:peptidoglycan/LPS O-acetylase OafA/YrhL